MTELAHQVLPDHALHRNLLARVTAAEKAVRTLELKVREVERQPRCRFDRTDQAWWSLCDPEDHQVTSPVVEVAAEFMGTRQGRASRTRRRAVTT